MSFPPLSFIGKMRRKLGLTQKHLAKLAGVSQSYIAKIESGKIEPTYSKAIHIFTILDDLSKKKNKTAKEIMNNKIVFVSYKDSLKKALSLMRKHNISQLPVIKNNRVIGSISENLLLDLFNIKRNPKNLSVYEVMEEPFPIISSTAPLSLVTDLLKFYRAVLVKEKDHLVGIITKADIIKAMEHES